MAQLWLIRQHSIMKAFTALLSDWPSKRSFLVLIWFLLCCGIACGVFGFILGEPWRGLRHLGLFSYFFFIGLYAHRVCIRREQSRKQILQREDALE
jgi:Kef-type K+ transport system membrane component KefB